MISWAKYPLADSNVLLTTTQMGRADRAAIADGVPGSVLMENAGASIAWTVLERFALARRILVLCGPGNNGGDGYVIARLLKRAGRSVTLAAFGNAADLKGDAAHMAGLWDGRIEPLEMCEPDGADLVIDAIFGAGLTRGLDETIGAVLTRVRSCNIPVIAVDVPSGIDGTTGIDLGGALKADITVTFFRKKPGHLLLPGREHAGELVLADIGISGEVLRQCFERHETPICENHPDIWWASRPDVSGNVHKYQRGHVGILSGAASSTGAARLAANAAMRAGAGLVSLLSPPSATLVNAAHATAVMVKPFKQPDDLIRLLGAARVSCLVIGPALGLNEDALANLDAVLGMDGRCPLVLDADALTLLSTDSSARFSRLNTRCVLTPHHGEFARLFPDIDHSADRVGAARLAATRANAVLVVKGPDSVIAHPDGRVIINANAPPELATAGSGDILAGVIGALLAGGMPAFEAAAAGVWIDGAAGQAGARQLGKGLSAEDLPLHIAFAIKSIWT